MKKMFIALALLLLSFGLTKSAQAYEPWDFGIYSGIKEPADFTIPGATLGHKVGTASCETILGIISWGDCSLQAAMKNGKISKVTAADWDKKFILLYGVKTLKVYGN